MSLASALVPVPLPIAQRLGAELHAGPPHHRAAIERRAQGAAVLLMARHREDAGAALGDERLLAREERLSYLRELKERCAAFAMRAKEQGALTAELRARVPGAGANYIGARRSLFADRVLANIGKEPGGVIGTGALPRPLASSRFVDAQF